MLKILKKISYGQNLILCQIVVSIKNNYEKCVQKGWYIISFIKLLPDKIFKKLKLIYFCINNINFLLFLLN